MSDGSKYLQYEIIFLSPPHVSLPSLRDYLLILPPFCPPRSTTRTRPTSYVLRRFLLHFAPSSTHQRPQWVRPPDLQQVRQGSVTILASVSLPWRCAFSSVWLSLQPCSSSAQHLLLVPSGMFLPSGLLPMQKKRCISFEFLPFVNGIFFSMSVVG